MILFDYTAIIAKQTPAPQTEYPFGFKYDRATPDLTALTDDELQKLLTETNIIKDSLLDEISKRAWGKDS